MSRRILPLFAFGTFVCCGIAVGQTPAVDAGAPTTVIRTGTTEVILDLVVHDKHHHAITNLKPEEVQVFEDGVPQKVKVFRNIEGTEQLQSERQSAQTATLAAPGHPNPVNSLRQVNFVSIIFAQIAPLNLEFAREAVQEFLKSDNLPNTYVTVYKMNLGLSILQVYTSDKDALAKAVNAGTKGLYSKVGVDMNPTVASSILATTHAAEVNANIANASQLPGSANMASGSAGSSNNEQAIVNSPLWARGAADQDAATSLGNALVTQARIESGIRFAGSEVSGMNAMDALRLLIHSQEKLPGRKVILYLSDGLTLPVNRRDVFDNVISYANRAGVSFYTIDTRGLNATDPMMQSLAQQERIAADSISQKNDPQTAHREDDDIQLSAVSNSQLAMTELAESTGGFAVTNTNQIALPMQHIMEDIRTHYELAYSPTSTVYDGHFRKIEVKVSRPKVEVQTRKGYFALPELNGEPLQPYEMTALNAINARPQPVAFPYQADLIEFQPKQNFVEYQLAFEVPVSGLLVMTNPKTGKARFQASLVAIIHKADGEIISKISRDVVRELPADSVAQLSTDRILYAEPVELAPGRYLMDTAVTDELAGKTTVKRISVFVHPNGGLGLSSLEVVRQLDPLSGPRNPYNPFELEKIRITPTLADSVASGKPVGLYFVVYPAKTTSPENPKVVLQVFRDGKEVARKPLALPGPDADGSIPMLVQVAPDPGHCDIRITAQQGSLVAESVRSLKIE